MSKQGEPISAFSTARVVAEVLAPLAARGLIVRRPLMVRLQGHGDFDARAVERLRALRDKRGSAPLLLSLGGRRLAVVLAPGDAREALARTPDPFSPASREKRAALGRFQPHGVLISEPSERPPRRRLNTEALDSGRPRHRIAEALRPRIEPTADRLAMLQQPVEWNEFNAQFQRLVRELVLGDRAADDTELTDELAALRRGANWSWLAPPQARRRRRFLVHLSRYFDDPEPGSLIHHAVAQPAAAQARALDQVPHWLFAFDAAAIAAFTALAMIALRPDALSRARTDADRGGELPYLRACVLEVLRLWPTTPAILREVVADTELGGTPLRSGTSLLIFSPLFHRDNRLNGSADGFVPERWLRDGRVDADPEPGIALLPFSDGAARCPAQELVLMVCSQLIARTLTTSRVTPHGRFVRRLMPEVPLPVSLNHVGLELELQARPTAQIPTERIRYESAHLARSS